MIIGAYGNLGTELRRQTRHDVIPVGRAEWENLGASDFAGVDAVVHAASDLRSPLTERPVALFQSELMVTARLLERMRDYGVPRLMYVSSCAVYGASENTAEDEPCRPVTVNGHTKLLNEKIIAEFCGRHGIQWEACRVFNTFGGADHFSVVSRILEASRRHQPIRVHNGGNDERDFIHVADVAAILLTLLERQPTGRFLNVGTGQPTRIGALIATAQEENPHLMVEYAEGGAGVNRSVAKTERLRACVGDFAFKAVLDYLRETIRVDAETCPSHS